MFVTSREQLEDRSLTSRTAPAAIAFGVGAFLGGAVGLLLAPARGRDIRAALRERGRTKLERQRSRVAEVTDGTRQRLRRAKSDARRAVREGGRTLRRVSAHGTRAYDELREAAQEVQSGGRAAAAGLGDTVRRVVSDR